MQLNRPLIGKAVEDRLYSLNALKVYHIKAEKMIEDWLLYDIEGICTNIKIKRPSKIKGKNGLEKIQYLFKKGNRIYQKGYNSNNLINSLDIQKIRNALKKEFCNLEKILYPNISKLC
ncbi:MAG: hypothetical protein V1773_10790 [bacterium]